MGGAKNSPFYSLSHISQNDKIWDSFTLPKKYQKIYIHHVTQPLNSADSFPPEIAYFLYQEMQIQVGF